MAVSDEDTWFTYHYWQDDAFTPDFARCVDIHCKYGYDTVSSFSTPRYLHRK